MLTSLVATIAALVPALQSQGWRDLDGKPCPEIEAETWINTGGATPSTAGLKGKVFLIAFFTTTEPACLAKVETPKRRRTRTAWRPSPLGVVMTRWLSQPASKTGSVQGSARGRWR